MYSVYAKSVMKFPKTLYGEQSPKPSFATCTIKNLLTRRDINDCSTGD